MLIIYHNEIPMMINVFESVFSHEPHLNLELIEYDPSPLVSQMSHYSHRAPMCPLEQVESP